MPLHFWAQCLGSSSTNAPIRYLTLSIHVVAASETSWRNEGGTMGDLLSEGIPNPWWIIPKGENGWGLKLWTIEAPWIFKDEASHEMCGHQDNCSSLDIFHAGNDVLDHPQDEAAWSYRILLVKQGWTPTCLGRMLYNLWVKNSSQFVNLSVCRQQFAKHWIRFGVKTQHRFFFLESRPPNINMCLAEQRFKMISS